MVDVLTLIGESKTPDEYGDIVTKKNRRLVFCRVESVGQKEFYQAAAVGFKPEIKFVLADYLDYQNEQLALYNGILYHVLRTYRTGQKLELVCYTEVNPT